MKDEPYEEKSMKDEITEVMQTEAIVDGYIALEEAINKLLDAGIQESSILLSVRVIYHDIMEERLNEK